MNVRRTRSSAQPTQPEIPPGPIDWWLLAILVLLLCVGLLAVLSSSGPVSQRTFGESYHFFRNQLMFMGLGAVAITILCLVPRGFINRLHYWSIGIALVLLVLCPIIGPRINGARRWIDLGVMMIQPMEFTRVALVLYLSYYLSSKQSMVKDFFRGPLPPCLVTAVIGLLLMKQPDYGGTAIMCLLLLFLFLAGGTSFKHIAGIAVVCAVGGFLFIMIEPYRLARVMAFLDPFADKHGSGYQIMQSLYALGSGGLFGVGIGASVQKTSYLPEAHNDYIMAIVGEEAGFFGITVVMVLFALFFYRSYRVVLGQKDLRDRLCAYGLTIVIALSFTINLAVVLGIAPPKGIAMPFISYGGSSLLSNMICAGLLLHYSRTSRE